MNLPRRHRLLAVGFWLSHLMAASFAVSAGAAPNQAGQATLAEWTFNTNGQFQGWQPNGHLREVAVTNGVLSCRAAGSDPILELRAPRQGPPERRPPVLSLRPRNLVDCGSDHARRVIAPRNEASARGPARKFVKYRGEAFPSLKAG